MTAGRQDDEKVKDKGAPKRTIVGWRNDSGSRRFQCSMQLIDRIAVDPERHPHSRLWCFIQVHSGCAKRKGNRIGIEEDEIRSVEALIDRQA
jgi:hypothetical protein